MLEVLRAIAPWLAVLVAGLSMVMTHAARRDAVRKSEIDDMREENNRQWESLGSMREQLATVPSGAAWVSIVEGNARTEEAVKHISAKMDNIDNQISMLVENELKDTAGRKGK